MKSKKQLKDYRTSLTPHIIQWCNNNKMIQVRVANMETKNVTISVTTTNIQTTTARTATKHMLAHHHTVPISLSPLPYLESRCQRGIRPAACELCRFCHTGRPSQEPCIHPTNIQYQHIIPTYTHNALPSSTPTQNYYYIDHGQHKRSKYTHLSKTTHKQKTTNTILENEKYTPKNEIEQIAQELQNIINTPIQWCIKNNAIKNNMTKI